MAAADDDARRLHVDVDARHLLDRAARAADVEAAAVISRPNSSSIMPPSALPSSFISSVSSQPPIPPNRSVLTDLGS